MFYLRSTLITCNENWSRHPKKIMSSSGVIHYSFLEPSLRRNIVADFRKCTKDCLYNPALINNPFFFKTTSHITHIIEQKLNHLQYETLPHSLHSPNLTLTDYLSRPTSSKATSRTLLTQELFELSSWEWL